MILIDPQQCIESLCTTFDNGSSSKKTLSLQNFDKHASVLNLVEVNQNQS